ncbi:MAG: CcmD family protein [Bacteroidia bacterium]
MKNKAILLSLILLVVFINSFAQPSGEIEMADKFRADGKIYVVVGVITIVFTGIVLYLINIDRKISKLEKKIQNSIE